MFDKLRKYYEQAQAREAKQQNAFFLRITLILGNQQYFYYHRLQAVVWRSLVRILFPLTANVVNTLCSFYQKSDRVLHLQNQLNEHQLQDKFVITNNCITSPNILVLCLTLLGFFSVYLELAFKCVTLINSSQTY
ncbi:unnamed protein product [Paramecium octaurelia]|uniref:Uncharacterized protein n=1 Tax=Paramecium octaurelia TaxID=43137 RepID=A0A8S1U3X5_PAROT|nr:unnamed protein product [Paramecium octaurelia]